MNEYDMKALLPALRVMRPFAELVNKSSGKIPVDKLSFADWYELSKFYHSKSDEIERAGYEQLE